MEKKNSMDSILVTACNVVVESKSMGWRYSRFSHREVETRIRGSL